MSRTTVTDLSVHWKKKGAEEERARIVEWLGQVERELAAEPVIEERTDENDDRMTADQKLGAQGVLAVLTEKLKEL